MRSPQSSALPPPCSRASLITSLASSPLSWWVLPPDFAEGSLTTGAWSLGRAQGLLSPRPWASVAFGPAASGWRRPSPCPLPHPPLCPWSTCSWSPPAIGQCRKSYSSHSSRRKSTTVASTAAPNWPVQKSFHCAGHGTPVPSRSLGCLAPTTLRPRPPLLDAERPPTALPSTGPLANPT